MARKDKDFLGLEVVNLEDASVLGEVDGLIVDETQERVVGLVIDIGLYEAKAVSFDDVKVVGDDAVMIDSGDMVKPISQHEGLSSIAERDVHLDEALALSEAGEIVGLVGDFYVDARNGAIAGIEILPSEGPEDSIRIIPKDALVRIGRELVMVSADYADRAVTSPDAL